MKLAYKNNSPITIRLNKNELQESNQLFFY